MVNIPDTLKLKSPCVICGKPMLLTIPLHAVDMEWEVTCPECVKKGEVIAETTPDAAPESWEYRVYSYLGRFAGFISGGIEHLTHIVAEVRAYDSTYNRRLMAVALDLLDALESLTNEDGCYGDCSSYYTGARHSEGCRKACAVIAKAKGEV